MKRVLFVLFLLSFLSVGATAREREFICKTVSAQTVEVEGKRCLQITTSFTLKGLKGQNVKICADVEHNIYEPGGGDLNVAYQAKTISRKEVVASDKENYEDYKFLAPWDKLDLLPGRHMYIVSIYVKTDYGELHQDSSAKGKYYTASAKMDGPSIAIQNLSLTQNVTNENGTPCLEVSYEFVSNYLEGKEIDIYAYLIDENAGMARNKYAANTIDDFVAQREYSVPRYESTRHKGKFLFPNKDVSPLFGEHGYCIQLVVFARNSQNVRDVRTSSWFYTSREGEYTSSYRKQTGNNSYASSNSSSSSQKQDYSNAIGLGILAGLAAIAIDAFVNSDTSSSSRSSSRSSYSGSSSYGSSYGSSSSYSSYGSSSSSSSYRSSSSSSTSSSSSGSSSSSSAPSKKKHQCEVTIWYTDNGDRYKLTARNIEVWFGRNGGWANYWVDDKGRCTITWDEDRGDTITKILFSELKHGSLIGTNNYKVEGIELKPGGSYSLEAIEYI